MNEGEPMFERMTERARQVVVLAQDEAQQLRHSHLGTEHLLLGLLREGEGLAARVLESLDVTVDEVRAEVSRIVGMGEDITTENKPLSARARKVLELSLREALSLGHNYIGTEHVLLGLVRENEGVAARILIEAEAPAERVRNEILRMLTTPRKAAEPVRTWNRADVSLSQVLSRGKELFRVVGIADEPTAIVENVVTGERESHVISSRNFGQFSLLEPRK